MHIHDPSHAFSIHTFAITMRQAQVFFTHNPLWSCFQTRVSYLSVMDDVWMHWTSTACTVHGHASVYWMHTSTTTVRHTHKVLSHFIQPACFQTRVFYISACPNVQLHLAPTTHWSCTCLLSAYLAHPRAPRTFRYAQKHVTHAPWSKLSVMDDVWMHQTSTACTAHGHASVY